MQDSSMTRCARLPVARTLATMDAQLVSLLTVGQLQANSTSVSFRAGGDWANVLSGMRNEPGGHRKASCSIYTNVTRQMLPPIRTVARCL